MLFLAYQWMNNTCKTRINAVLSDYDGTLSPTNTLRSNAESIPEQLEGVLWEISQSIPIGIISSKDYHFLHPRTGFARILSCILCVETISHRIHKETSREVEEGTNYSDIPSCVRERYILSKLAESIELDLILAV